jgi:hypothetical protein
MSHEENDKTIRDLIARVFLPPDECPANSASIEALLDKARGRPLSDEQVVRMLKKAKGELPVGVREEEEEEPPWSEEELTAEQREFVFLCRNEGIELPPEIEEKLRQLREKADAEEEEDEGDDELDS